MASYACLHPDCDDRHEMETLPDLGRDTTYVPCGHCGSEGIEPYSGRGQARQCRACRGRGGLICQKRVRQSENGSYVQCEVTAAGWDTVENEPLCAEHLAEAGA